MKWGRIKDTFTTIVYVDGLAKIKRHEYGAKLRKLDIPTRKVQGIPKDEVNALVRLADAVAGFVNDAIGAKSKEINNLF